MTTGDLHNCVERLRRELRAVRYDGALDEPALTAGEPAALLPLLHHGFLGFSPHVSRWLSARGYDLYAKSDLRFVELIHRCAREELSYRHALTVQQFLTTTGFAERKMLFAIDMLCACRAKHDELAPARSASTAAPGATHRRELGAAVHSAPRPATRARVDAAGSPRSPPSRVLVERASNRSPTPRGQASAKKAAPPGGGTARPAPADEPSRPPHAAADAGARAPPARSVGPPAAGGDIEATFAALLAASESRVLGALEQLDARLGLLEGRVARLEHPAHDHAPTAAALDEPKPRAPLAPAGPLGGRARWSRVDGQGDGALFDEAWARPGLGAASSGGGTPAYEADDAHDASVPPPGALDDANPPEGGAHRQSAPPRAEDALGLGELAVPTELLEGERFDPHNPSAEDYLRHLEMRFEATSALMGA